MVLYFYIVCDCFPIIARRCRFVYDCCQGERSRLAGSWVLSRESVEVTSHAWLHKGSSTMAECSTSEAFEVLGLEPAASLDAVKCPYRTLAKKFHPDQNSDPEAKALFQRLNKLYRTLLKQKNSTSDSQQCHDENSDSYSHIQSDISIVMRENTDSITIGILDMLFLVFLGECEEHHGIAAIDRGHSGLQFRFPYTSPFDQKQYGSLSLTFYPPTSRLLVQGTSYLLWMEEHLPAIYGEAETRYLADISSWRSLALHRGIGIKRDSRHRRDRRQISNTHGTDTVLLCTFDCRDSASAATPVADSAGTITASPADSYHHDAPLALVTDSCTRSDDTLVIAAAGFSQTLTCSTVPADGCTQAGTPSPAYGCPQAGTPSTLPTDGCTQPGTPSAPPANGGTQAGTPAAPSHPRKRIQTTANPNARRPKHIVLWTGP